MIGTAAMGFTVGGFIGLMFMRKYGPSGPIICFMIAAALWLIYLFN